MLRLESEQHGTEQLQRKLLASVDRVSALQRELSQRDAQMEDMRAHIVRLETDFEEQSRFKEALLLVSRKEEKEAGEDETERPTLKPGVIEGT